MHGDDPAGYRKEYIVKKPKKPTVKSKRVILESDILSRWDGKSAKEAVGLLIGILSKYPEAEFSTDWNYASTDMSIKAQESDATFDERMREWNADMLKWKQHRIEALQSEIDEMKEQA